ncbi:class I SAM-dependent methyltransferase [Candidatus Lucifugimonas marina]|uniref:Methyltransferase domain-containing protein n=1 Tax=Candidatus Lucifugimonas marina TaxID=3038979 RepID=A0AAJ5ZIN0_9CHLR|nr:methyltransferase domain-containing protein [SAR202 cluster bacterium JH702]MDG0868243.1 methyltransferase domain-containing protein [SAR202 cluster bacterium JH639]WFG34887.1 methyltransferase domain-containing protein [SAR202 cluster bacterium JH545]WFG38838.1 methyltransferase domain-containing protein [SAR202 cluster bacterium JH1073]
MRVDTTGLPTDNWHHFLRLRDLRQIIDTERPDRAARVLELGAGDGVQTSALRELFDNVTPTDPAPFGDVAGMVVADAASLPFEDDSFDLIFSSNVLEHVEDLDAAFAEMKRVLAPGGMMIHSMPTGTWKMIQVVGRPIASAVKIFRRLFPGVSRNTGRVKLGGSFDADSSVASTRSLFQRIVGLVIPTVHGVSGNHFSEFVRFRPRWWKRRFERADIDCYRTQPLFLHSPYDLLPYRFMGLRDRFGRAGFASVDVFWLRDRS